MQYRGNISPKFLACASEKSVSIELTYTAHTHNDVLLKCNENLQAALKMIFDIAYSIE